jgi:S1-C subfamily serine protease
LILAIAINATVHGENRPTDNPANASYRVRTDAGRQSSYGSATAISRNVLVTNAHVVGQIGTQVVVDQLNGTAYTGDVIESDQLLDLAFVRVEDSAELQWAAYSDTDPVIGQACKVLGYPYAGPLQTRESNVTATAVNDHGQPTRWLSAQVRLGDSGGGVFDADNKLIAVTRAMQATGEGSALPVSLVSKLVEQAKSRFDSEGIAYTYRVKCKQCGDYHEQGVELTQL